jgi:hypothetical protein
MAKPRESPTSAGFTSPTKSRYQCGVASLLPLATVADAETFYICTKKTSYEYCLNHNPQHDASKKPSELPTTTTLPLQDQEQYQAGDGAASLILMTTSH